MRPRVAFIPGQSARASAAPTGAVRIGERLPAAQGSGDGTASLTSTCKSRRRPTANTTCTCWPPQQHRHHHRLRQSGIAVEIAETHWGLAEALTTWFGSKVERRRLGPEGKEETARYAVSSSFLYFLLSVFLLSVPTPPNRVRPTPPAIAKRRQRTVAQLPDTLPRDTQHRPISSSVFGSPESSSVVQHDHSPIPRRQRSERPAHCLAPRLLLEHPRKPVVTVIVRPYTLASVRARPSPPADPSSGSSNERSGCTKPSKLSTMSTERLQVMPISALVGSRCSAARNTACAFTTWTITRAPRAAGPNGPWL